MEFPIFPLEILTSILIFLHDFSDVASLKQCCYINRALRVESQKLLYKVVCIEEVDAQGPVTPTWNSNGSDLESIQYRRIWKKFFDLISILPNIVNYVEALKISSISLMYDDAEKYIPLILPNLIQLRSISISNICLSRWGQIPETIQDAFIWALKYRNITAFHISCPQIPVGYIQKLPTSLECFTSGALKFDDAAIAELRAQENLPQTVSRKKKTDSLETQRCMLKDLTIDGTENNSPTILWYSSTFSHFDLSKLRSLTLRLASRSRILGETNTLLQSVSSRLEHLTMLVCQTHKVPLFCNATAPNWTSHDSYVEPPPDLSIFPHLQSLTLESTIMIWTHHTQWSFPSPIAWIIRILQNSSKLSLKRIRFHFAFRGSMSERQVKAIPWQDLIRPIHEEFPENIIVEFYAQDCDDIVKRALLQVEEELLFMASRIVFTDKTNEVDIF